MEVVLVVVVVVVVAVAVLLLLPVRRYCQARRYDWIAERCSCSVSTSIALDSVRSLAMLHGGEGLGNGHIQSRLFRTTRADSTA